MCGGDSDLLVQFEINKSSVDTLHCREEVVGEDGIVKGENFITDSDAGDFSSRRIFHLGKVLIAKTDDELNAGVSKGFEDMWVSIIELDSGSSDGFD
uniref:Uncharacterized protein n=1 Tax=Solanum lycopersicum TaxID=4081 RepID=A0A3Q7HX90_SOLLC